MSRPSFVTNRTPQRNILILCGISDVVGATASHRSDSPHRRESLLRHRREPCKEHNKNIFCFRSPGRSEAWRGPRDSGSLGSREHDRVVSVTASSGNLRSAASIAASARSDRTGQRMSGREAPTCQPVETQLSSLQGVLVVRIMRSGRVDGALGILAGRQESAHTPGDMRPCRREMEAGERSKRPPGLPCKSHFDGSAQRLRYGCDGMGHLIGWLAIAGPMGGGAHRPAATPVSTAVVRCAGPVARGSKGPCMRQKSVSRRL